MRGLIAGLYEDWISLDERVESLSGEIDQIGEKETDCRRLMSIPGVGPLISTAVVAAIGTGERLRRMAGLVPKVPQLGVPGSQKQFAP
ncbi:transposase [Bradyrhizobium japonicum]|uniref:Transposase n=1 Tax=Bradyrhizobium japonicum TaxID=375 RepID=A0ABV2RH52_BRAJP